MRFALVLALLTVMVVATSASAQSAGDVVDKMIAAHGGMEKWNAASSVSFTDAWGRPGAAFKRKSHVQVEQGRRRAVLDFPDFNATIGWDGEKAWSTNWSMPVPPRFLALLNYYFVCLPWLVKDPGVVLHEPESRTLWDDPTEYIAIRVTYEAGVGDTPDDYYVLIIHPETHRLHGCEYVVTYPGLVPEGKTSTPPHILVFESYETVDGLVVPTAFTIHNLDESVYAVCEITDWSFSRPFDPARAEMPEGAVVDESLER